MVSRSIGRARALRRMTVVFGQRAVLLAGVGIAAVGIGTIGSIPAGPAEAKTPGKTYCFYQRCHRVRTLAETRKAIGRSHVVVASFYDSAARDRFNPSDLTSSGEVFRAHKADNAASPIWPNGTKLLVWNPANGRAAVLRINNAGPYWGNRTLDVSRATAIMLGFAGRGVARLHTKVIYAPTPAEAAYSRGRRYRPVPGYLGGYQTLEIAQLAGTRELNRHLRAQAVHAAAGRSAKPIYPQFGPPVALAETQSPEAAGDAKGSNTVKSTKPAKAVAVAKLKRSQSRRLAKAKVRSRSKVSVKRSGKHKGKARSKRVKRTRIAQARRRQARRTQTKVRVRQTQRRSAPASRAGAITSPGWVANTFAAQGV